MQKPDKWQFFSSFKQQKGLLCSTPLQNNSYVRFLHQLFVSQIEANCSGQLNHFQELKTPLIENIQQMCYNMTR